MFVFIHHPLHDSLLTKAVQSRTQVLHLLSSVINLPQSEKKNNNTGGTFFHTTTKLVFWCTTSVHDCIKFTLFFLFFNIYKDGEGITGSSNYKERKYNKSFLSQPTSATQHIRVEERMLSVITLIDEWMKLYCTPAVGHIDGVTRRRHTIKRDLL